MKKNLLLYMATAFMAFSCSSDDNGINNTDPDPDPDPDPTPVSIGYFPIAENGNEWRYEITSDQAETTADTLSIAGEATMANKLYKLMHTTSPAGFFTGLMNDNHLHTANDKVFLKGSLSFNQLGEDAAIEVELNDFIIFDNAAANNTLLSEVPGTFQQDLGGQPLSGEYKMRSRHLQSLASYTSPSGVTYTDVKVVRITLNLKMSTVFDFNGFPINQNILDAQDVIISDLYYAKEIGMVHANNKTSYTLNPTFVQLLSQLGVELPFPSSGETFQDEIMLSAIVE